MIEIRRGYAHTNTLTVFPLREWMAEVAMRIRAKFLARKLQKLGFIQIHSAVIVLVILLRGIPP